MLYNAHAVRMVGSETPVVVGSGRVVAFVHLLQEVAQLGLIKSQGLQHAGLLDQMEEEQGEGVPGRLLSQAKDVKLPAVLSILQAPSSWLSMHFKLSFAAAETLQEDRHVAKESVVDDAAQIPQHLAATPGYPNWSTALLCCM